MKYCKFSPVAQTVKNLPVMQEPQEMWVRKKKSSSTHQNTDTSFPNQETLISH